MSLHLKQFPLTSIPDSINSELTASHVQRMNRQSHVCRTWIGLNTAEVRSLNESATLDLFSFYEHFRLKAQFFRIAKAGISLLLL